MNIKTSNIIGYYPSTYDLCNDGDIFFNTGDGKIYVRAQGGWIVCMNNLYENYSQNTFSSADRVKFDSMYIRILDLEHKISLLSNELENIKNPKNWLESEVQNF